MEPIFPSEDHRFLLESIKRLHEEIRDAVTSACERSAVEALSAVAYEEEGDTIYAVDRVSEELLVRFFEQEIAPRSPVVLIAEGLAEGKIVLPRGTDESQAQWRVIVDPIDGTRGLMYQKRSGWVLTGVAPNRGPETSLRDIELAVMTEIPLVKQHLADCAWAIKGQGALAERSNRITGERTTIPLRPSGSNTIAHGFAGLVRLFPGVREELAAIDDEIVRELLGPPLAGKAQCFEDQYASTGGQLWELMCGHDRFIADLRPLMAPVMQQKGFALSICCHPYDLCTELIAREAGVVITNARGKQVDSLLAVEPDVDWVGYANPTLQKNIEPLLQGALKRRGLMAA